MQKKGFINNSVGVLFWNLIAKAPLWASYTNEWGIF